MDKEFVTKVIKEALGSCVAIALADYLKFDYAASAGIIGCEYSLV